MASGKKALVATVMAASVAGSPAMLPKAALADDYSDLLDVLRAKGSLTKHEYDTLLAKHVRHSAPCTNRARIFRRQQRWVIRLWAHCGGRHAAPHGGPCRARCGR